MKRHWVREHFAEAEMKMKYRTTAGKTGNHKEFANIIHAGDMIDMMACHDIRTCHDTLKCHDIMTCRDMMTCYGMKTCHVRMTLWRRLGSFRHHFSYIWESLWRHRCFQKQCQDDQKGEEHKRGQQQLHTEVHEVLGLSRTTTRHAGIRQPGGRR